MTTKLYKAVGFTMYSLAATLELALILSKDVLNFTSLLLCVICVLGIMVSNGKVGND